MRARTIVVALVIAATLAGATALPAHAARRYVATYVPGVWVGCDGRVALDWFAGKVADPSRVPCMGAVNHVPVSHLDRKVRVRIVDATGARIGGELRFYRPGRQLPPRPGRARQRGQRGSVLRGRRHRGTGRAARVTGCLHGNACGESGGIATTGKVVADFG